MNKNFYPPSVNLLRFCFGLIGVTEDTHLFRPLSCAESPYAHIDEEAPLSFTALTKPQKYSNEPFPHPSRYYFPFFVDFSSWLCCNF
jgi:hypothetical protein